MQDIDHFIQDANEIYAVAKMQARAEARGRATTLDSDAKFAEVTAYLAARGLSEADFASGELGAYKRIVDNHIDAFVDRWLDDHPGVTVDFVLAEAENRNQSLKGDFHIVPSSGELESVSLKVYRKKISRPQVCSGTFNSFVSNLLFSAWGVGHFRHPQSGERFRGADSVTRDEAIASLGYGYILPLVHRLDELHAEARTRFVESDEHRFFNKAVFARGRAEIGRAGAEVAYQILTRLDPQLIKARLLKMTGLDGAEALLCLDPTGFIDSRTNQKLREAVAAANSPTSRVDVKLEKQSIILELIEGERSILSVAVPFTINSNGAWYKPKARFSGERLHPKEGVLLRWGQRRPAKSRELATSVNTYLNFRRAGIVATAG